MQPSQARLFNGDAALLRADTLGRASSDFVSASFRENLR
jgi:hypothetical protein